MSRFVTGINPSWPRGCGRKQRAAALIDDRGEGDDEAVRLAFAREAEDLRDQPDRGDGDVLRGDPVLTAMEGNGTTNGKDAANLINGGVFVISEGSNMPSTPDAIDRFVDAKSLFGPGKAANAGGVAVSGLEMSQDSLRIMWAREDVDGRLKEIMKAIHRQCREAAEDYGDVGNYVLGANVAGFVKVADAMLDQGVV